MFVARKSPLDVDEAHGGDDEEDGEDTHGVHKPRLAEHGLDAGDGELGVPGVLAGAQGGRGHNETHSLTERSHAGSETNKNNKISWLWPPAHGQATKLGVIKLSRAFSDYLLLLPHLLKAASLTL